METLEHRLDAVGDVVEDVVGLGDCIVAVFVVQRVLAIDASKSDVVERGVVVAPS